MVEIVAIYGSPRRDGNSALLLDNAVKGARSRGAEVEQLHLRDFSISPCLELYDCLKSGECGIKDDFPQILERLERCDGMMVASPIFFYTVSAHAKILIDRCQSLWVRRNLLGEKAVGTKMKKGLFVSVGATRGRKLFDGALLTIKYFFEVFDMELHRTVLCRGIERKGEILGYEEYLAKAYEAGADLAETLASSSGNRG